MESAFRLAIILTFFKRDALKLILTRIKTRDEKVFNTLTQLLPKAASLVHQARTKLAMRPGASERSVEKFEFSDLTKSNCSESGTTADDSAELVDLVLSRDTKAIYYGPVAKLPFRIIEDDSIN